MRKFRTILLVVAAAALAGGSIYLRYFTDTFLSARVVPTPEVEPPTDGVAAPTNDAEPPRVGPWHRIAIDGFMNDVARARKQITVNRELVSSRVGRRWASEAAPTAPDGVPG